MSLPANGLELRSTITSGGELKLELVEVPIRALEAGEVLIKVEAAPINPSDLGLLTGPADVSTATAGGTPDRPTVTAHVPAQRLPFVAARHDESMTVGNEGAGTVIAAGAGGEALIGKRVAAIGGSMYAQYRIARIAECFPLPHGATAAEGASAFVNPLTALAMVETMRAEGHSALVHTAAASNLGQMLNRICIADGVRLVNIVRSEAQAAILRDLGASYIVDSSSESFDSDLADVLTETGATIAFDAIGGGTLANRILRGMETAANRKATTYSRYGSSVHKQVYIYGALDLGPTPLDRSYGLAWGVSGFLLTPFLMKAGAETVGRMRARVAAELTTTFASNYTATISLREVLDPATLQAYSRKATGEKYLIDPSR
ncbi:zinc-binding dehydrogenase [Sphingomonas sp. G-3-2-10]|uniref:zinc-binding dehydrogenase n=1 Tax=Sphingomonas sp. G-3-2-10 TaxID=2728838 RepID=UPI00146F2790|nr:zinc-binding dehydrogenase [Sphingomonas sp. G-3-2-10]NML04235.1 zinc-binding dehydrogenase [Sphingomonas sp. G-3-2-10]